MQVPSVPMTGKGAKVSLSFNDGVQTTTALELIPSYSHSGETLVDRVYTLGTGRMINSRPAANPLCFVDGILDGADVSSTTSNELAVTAGNVLVINAPVAIVANPAVSITRPATDEACWTAIVVDKTSGIVSAVKGADTTTSTGKAGLASTFGTGAGQMPLIDVGAILVCYLQLDEVAGTIKSNEIFFENREWASVSFAMMPSVGAVSIAQAMPKLHTGGVARDLYFAGKYWESTALAPVGDAQQWSVTPNTSSVSAVTFTGGPSESQVDNWSFTFNQLFTDSKALDAIYNRQGYSAIKLELASGHFFLFVGSFAGGITVEPGSFIVQQLSGSIQDRPYWSGQ